MRLLHWAIAAMILAALVMSTFVMTRIPASSPDKVSALIRHISVGSLIFVASMLRLATRGRTVAPPALSSGMRWADALAIIVHRLLEALTFLMIGSGIAMVIQENLIAVFLSVHGVLPVGLEALPLRAFHIGTASLLAATLALHVCGALYHQFILRDGLITRMSFGASAPGAPEDGEPAAL
ncbi:cytochrome b [Niveibacterium terrae]|uniref:cytochrome b n=1 Tax=Niveibacterium terrae TaxID=3373598 RepID=UPI003A8E9E04